jgi:hypothetical protein
MALIEGKMDGGRGRQEVGGRLSRHTHKGKMVFVA